MQNIDWFKDISKEDIPLVGGKGANLGEMYNAGIPIPPGFVITSLAFKKFLDYNKLVSKIYNLLDNLDVEDSMTLQKVAKEVQDLVLSADMPNDIKKEIIEAYDNLNVDYDSFKNVSKAALEILKSSRDLPYVAVRSSATAEDIPSISEDEYVLVKVNDKPFFGKMKELSGFIRSNDKIFIPAMDNCKVEWKRVSDIYKHAVNYKKLYKITTSTGKKITISPNHTLIVLDEDKLQPTVKEIFELKGREKLPVVRIMPCLGEINQIDILDYISKDGIIENNGLIMIKNNSSNYSIQQGLPRKINITKDFAYFLGIYAAEGSTYKTGVIITNSNEDIIGAARRYVESLNINAKTKINKHSLRIHCKTLVRFLNENCGVPNAKIKGNGKTCRSKEVPSFIFSCSQKIIGEYLRGCFDGDGAVEKTVSYYSNSPRLIAGISALLELLGIEFCINDKKAGYILSIQLKDIEKFKKEIGFLHPDKSRRLELLVNKYNNQAKHFEFKNSINTSKNIAATIRANIEKSLPNQEVIENFCPLCVKKVKKSSSYNGKNRYYCFNCRKSFYESDIVKKEAERYVHYDKKGRFLKGSIPWNKSINTYPSYSISKLKEIVNDNGIVQVTNIFNETIMWDEIVKIEEVDYNSWVYDFCVPDVENFAAGVGGIITHNSASFAGQQETYLNIKGTSNLIKAVQKCWASLYTARAIYYRIKNDFKHENVFIAVVIQKQIQSQKSGVIFSVNPMTNDENEIVIESAFGLGEVVVSGAVTPDEYILDKKILNVKEKRINKQDWLLTLDPNLGYTVKKNIPEEKGNEQKLSDFEIRKLGELTKKIELHYNVPQDIEYAIEGPNIYIVQSRPITTLKKVSSMQKQKEEFDSEPILKGLAASPGIATGPVRLVFDVNDMPKIQKGDVLVAQQTKPDYVVAMKKASAIVTDTGGTTCFGARTNVLTNNGFMEIEKVYDKINNGEKLIIFSYDYKNKKPVWKKIINAGKRKRAAVKISISQRGILNYNTLEITPDHKMYTFNNRELIKKELKDILKDEEYLCAVEKLPTLNVERDEEKLAYLLGALMSDGYLNINYYKTGNPRRGRIIFTQKGTKEKESFMNLVKTYYHDIFNENFSTTEKVSNSFIRGMAISGTAVDLMPYKLEPAKILLELSHSIDRWLLNITESTALNFLAGLIDGDGCFYENQLHIYVSKENVLKGVIVSCMKLGIMPQVTCNRDITHVQIVERMEDIINYTKRVKGKTNIRMIGTRFFAAKQIFGDVIEQVNFKGRIKPYVKGNLTLDADKITRNILPMADEQLRKEIRQLINSNIRMQRTKLVEELGYIDVYNLEVEAKEEMEHCYVVFTKNFTPLLVSNSHAAIVSRELGVACVVATTNATSILKDGDTITVDGYTGNVYKGEIKLKPQESEKEKYEKFGDVETITEIKVNVDLPDYAEKAAATRNDGIGLLRLELMIANKGIHPIKYMMENRDDEYIGLLVDNISSIASHFKNKTIWVRTSDFRTDEYRHLEGGEEEPVEDNPMIGWHGIRRSLEETNLLKAEFNAIKILHDRGLTNIGVMLPFVISVEEVKKAKQIMTDIGLDPCENIDFGVMIETPAACQIIRDICEEGIDFISFGTNDLTQLTLGIDRNNEHIAKLFTEMHPAVLSLIKSVIKTCKEYNVETSICGQAGSNEDMVEYLVKIGIDSISANIDAVDRIRNVVAKTEKKLLLGMARKNYI